MSFTIYRGYRIRPTGLSNPDCAYAIELHETILNRWLAIEWSNSLKKAEQLIDRRLAEQYPGPGWDANGSPVE